MAFTNYEHDVFVSYAHVDDNPMDGLDIDKGWVTTFINNLTKTLARRLGRQEAKIWMDYRLSGNTLLTPAILDTLRNSATILIIASPGYLASPWCQREQDTFLTLIKERKDAGALSNIFLIEFDQVDKDQMPVELADLLGYRFWIQEREGKAPRTLGMPVPKPEEQEYYDKLLDVAYDLSLELKRIKNLAENSQQPGIENTPPVMGIEVQVIPDAQSPDAIAYVQTIFLAEVTDDLELRREDIRRYLTQASIRVLPETSWYPHTSLAALESAMDDDLAKSDAYVQLLSEYPGKRPYNQQRTLAQIQYDRALAVGKPILQWRSQDLKLTSVVEPTYQSLLQSPTVRAEGIEDFKNAIKETLKQMATKPPAGKQFNGKIIFVGTDSNDRKLAEETICQSIMSQGLGCLMLPGDAESSVIAEYLKTGLLVCDVVMAVYCASEVTSMMKLLITWCKIIAQRDQPLHALAVYDGPPSPPGKARLNLMIPNLVYLNCRTEQGPLDDFLQQLSQN